MTANLPKISIITPSYNQGQFIEQTIVSVLSQKYPNLEYMVIDGGSKDNTLSILKKYQKYLIWESKKDNGQSDALNKGLKKATGEIIGYINSDDYLLDRTLLKVGEFFLKNKKAFWLTGKCRIISEDNSEIRKTVTLYKNFFLKYLRHKPLFHIVQFISQPATFWRREITDEIGYFDESLHYDMDYDYWLRTWRHFPLYFLDGYLGCYRIHLSSKGGSSPQTQFQVEHEIVSRYTNSKIILFLHKLHCWLSLNIYKKFFQ